MSSKTSTRVPVAMGDSFIPVAVLKHTQQASRPSAAPAVRMGAGSIPAVAAHVARANPPKPASVPPVQMGSASMPAAVAHVAKSRRPVESGAITISPAVLRHLRG